MNAPDLAELRRLLAEVRRAPPWKRDVGFIYQDPGASIDAFKKDVAHAHHTSGAALIVAAVNALPYLLAKVDAAEAMAEAADRGWDDLSSAELDECVDAYRKAGAE